MANRRLFVEQHATVVEVWKVKSGLDEIWLQQGPIVGQQTPVGVSTGVYLDIIGAYGMLVVGIKKSLEPSFLIFIFRNFW